MIRIERILCPIDFSEHSRHALDYAGAVAGWYGAAITVMHVHTVSVPLLPMDPVVAPQAYVPVALSDDERSSVMKAIESFVAGDRASGRRIEPLVEEALNVPGAIAARAGALRVDLIVMGTHGRTGFSRLVLGSVTEKVLRTAPCPVLCVPPAVHGADTLSGSAWGGVVLCPTDFPPASCRNST